VVELSLLFLLRFAHRYPRRDLAGKAANYFWKSAPDVVGS